MNLLQSLRRCGQSVWLDAYERSWVISGQLMLPVIEQLIGDRVNVNATLVFSQMMYEQVFDGYLRGLKRLIQRGESVSDVVCFTSVSISRLDTAIDPLIASSETYFGMIQAKLLYERYRNLYQSERWRSLGERANPLRLVWDCTGIPSQAAWRYTAVLNWVKHSNSSG